MKVAHALCATEKLTASEITSVCSAPNVINVDVHSAKMISWCEQSQRFFIWSALDAQLAVAIWYQVRPFSSSFDSKIIQILASTGDEFALRDGNTLFCKMDNDALDKLAQSDIESSAIDFRDGNTQTVPTANSTNNSSGSNNNSSEFGSMSGTRLHFSNVNYIAYQCNWR
jgi:hypothetical protein